MFNKKSEKGQAIILIIFAMIGLLGLTGLAVDGGMAFSDRRQAQGAADSAAWTAALTKANKENITQVKADALAIADQNGFPENSAHSIVTVTFADIPVAPAKFNGQENPCPIDSSPNTQITVQITSYVKTFFAPVVGVQQVTNKVESVTLACGEYHGGLFGGNAIVSLGNNMPADCAFDSGNSNAAHWNLIGGGLSSNTCAYSKNDNSVTIEPPYCVSAVKGGMGGFSDNECPGDAGAYPPSYISSIMPPNPCIGAITSGVYAGGGKVVTAGQTTFSNGVFCMDTEAKMNALTQKDVVLTNATLYVTAKEFDVKFAGKGSFAGTPFSGAPFSSTINSGSEYLNYYMIVTDNGHPCTTFTGNGNNKQVFEYRGNATSELRGTVLAPTACIDVRGNGTATINGQLIGNSVSSNGNAGPDINYVENQNHIDPLGATIQLLR